MKAVLLVAGAGERLQPLTATRPKHLLKVAGKPLMQFSLEALKHAGIEETVLVTHYRSEAIESYFGDGKEFGLKLSYVRQPQLLGTGNAAAIAEPFIRDEEFVLIYGDLLFGKKTIKTVADKFRSTNPAAVMGVVTVDHPENYGIIEQTSDGAVKRIVEKPEADKAPSKLANAGIYVFNQKIFDKIRQIKPSIRGEIELTDAITILAEQGDKRVLAAELTKEDWFDVGRPWDLLDANLWALNRMEHCVLGNVEEGAHLIGPVSVAASAHIRSGAYIEGPVFIDEQADIGPNCYIRSGTSLGKKTRVGNAVEIKNSIIMDNTHVGHLSYVGDSIIGENCNLGAGTITANLRFDENNIKMKIKDKHTDTGRNKLGTILGDNVKTGINTLFMPGIKVGTNTWVGANVMVQQDLPANSTAQLKQTIEIKQN
ncbi:bifunctional sugar-1-phosphate nucleotidylyltransferase/acetyltransferase [Candidatus Bathycorpusculum sp.]|uniref:bifunctional sugar-1-phosphate nucleotidylyltransferase/acetyltransferase n=1 Tax=Candidatus Bathycorpusculum sp. TaxID=2994959 RepID=UPI0028390DFE|nr:sugar phosphate nucleotidyltransferase [Candidatus Termitimicrobium sp.]MCL2686315.1 sugar phosphate nucleotidyltransferase [Candidatus Termitimicrobium sp.]